MHVLDYIFNRISSIYRFNNYPLYEKTYMIMLYVAGLSLRDLSKRFFGYLKKRTKRFYNNINTWRIQSIEDYAITIAIIRNLHTTIKTQGGVLPS